VRCVVVDNNKELAASISELLRSQGVDVVGTAHSGAEAIELIERLQPDVALVDIELGDADGLALSHRLASRVPATRIILISSYGPDDVGDLITATPAAGFLPKDELRAATIARVLG
jgi:two-component system, NarL family, nitrate/nitrite response regulator NarL